MTRTLERFRVGQRVVVIDEQHPQYEQRGTVQSLRVTDGGAVVKMEREIPEGDAVVMRGELLNDTLILYPDQCRDDTR